MPIRGALNRLRRYEAKIDPEVIEKRITKHQKAIIEQMSAYFNEIFEVEEKTKVVLDEVGVSVALSPFYFAYIRALWRLVKRYSGNRLFQEIRIIEKKWQARGLNLAVMEKLRTNIFGLTRPII